MANVVITYKDVHDAIISSEEIATTGDATYVFEDIANHVHKDDEFGSVPEGTKEIQITIKCDM